MGLFWDLIQHNQISRQREHAESLQEQVSQLERRVDDLSSLLREVIMRLEKHVGTDLDRDGRVG